MIYNIKEANREFKYQGGFQRVFPLSSHYNNDKIYEKSTDKNKVMMRWYNAMCKKNARWC